MIRVSCRACARTTTRTTIHSVRSPTSSLAPYQEGLGGVFRAFPDLTIEIHGVFAVADRVAARSTFTGTHSGALADMPATGKPVSVDAMILSRIDGDKIAEGWVLYDYMGMMQQPGTAPAPEGR